MVRLFKEVSFDVKRSREFVVRALLTSIFAHACLEHKYLRPNTLFWLCRNSSKRCVWFVCSCVGERGGVLLSLHLDHVSDFLSHPLLKPHWRQRWQSIDSTPVCDSTIVRLYQHRELSSNLLAKAISKQLIDLQLLSVISCGLFKEWPITVDCKQRIWCFFS